MDVVNELYDTIIGDHMYAWLFPACPGTYDNPLTTNTTWQHKPATKYFSIPPSQAAYMSAWPRDNIYRQMINLFLIAWIFGLFVYLIFAGLSYIFVFDKETMKHPKYLENQVWKEIKQANIALPGMSLLTLPIFLAELRGFSRLYDTDGPGLWYDILQFPLFIFFTDFCIYWIHRGLHHPRVYRILHKPHHKWIIPTPYASHAFHPVDGFAQSLPYHIFPFIFPLHKLAYLALFVFVNFWAIFIHDGEYVTNSPFINGAACHTIHHLYFNYNYGQYTTLWDRLGKSYRNPNGESLSDWKKGVKETENMVVEVEGEGDQTHDSVSVKKNN